MANQKRTIKRDSVFHSSPPADRPTQGLPQAATTRQTAIWLSDEELDWLDTHIQQIKRGGWRSITRSALLRALIQAAMAQDLDLRGVSGDADLAQRLSAQK